MKKLLLRVPVLVCAFTAFAQTISGQLSDGVLAGGLVYWTTTPGEGVCEGICVECGHIDDVFTGDNIMYPNTSGISDFICLWSWREVDR